MDRLDSLAARSGLPALRIRQRAVRGEASEHELSLPQVPQVLLAAHRHGHAELEPGRSEVGDRGLHADNEPQGRLQHEAAPGP